ncbi:hypothetical protein Mapa_016055 [Marchantia paleacea]|nr:hypothetical protein Mapa_016055 [Marchantia paleacea]
MPINEPTKPAHHSHRRTVGFANSTGFEAGKKNKLRSAMIISPMNGEISEKEIKVQFSRPASTWGAKEIGFPAIESVERVFKVKCYRPSALEDMSEERTKSNEVTRANSTPCTATEEFLEAKFGLHRDRSKDTGLQPLRQYYGPREAVDGAALPVPCLETADVSELMHRRALGYPTSDRATIDVGTSPLPSPRKNGAPVGSDFPMGQAEKGPLYGYGQQYNVLTVGKIVLEEEPDDDARSMWRRRSEGIFAVSVDGINQRKISGDFLKVFFDFLAKERSMFFKRGKQYLGAKSKKLHGPTTGSISCTCFKPAVKDVDDITFAPTGTADVRSVLVPRRMSIWTWNHKKVAE